MSSPPIFEQLQAKASQWCSEYGRYKEECRVFAEHMRVEYIEYLGARSADIEFHVLNENLERMKDEGTTLSPRLQPGDDGFIYFGLTIVFKMNHGCLDEHVRIGVQRVRNQWRVRWNQTEMAHGDPPHLAFFQKVTALIEAKFSTPFHKQRGALGFIPVVSNDHLALLPPAELRIAAEADAPTAESGGQPAKG